MAKLAVSKRVGIPVPRQLPEDVTHLVVYYGVPGFQPSYSQEARIALPIADVPKVTKDTFEYYVFDTASLPPQTTDAVELYFTLMDGNDAEEGDFSPVISVPFDRTPPVKLAAPVIL
jgi:hypothetical protein